VSYCGVPISSISSTWVSPPVCCIFIKLIIRSSSAMSLLISVLYSVLSSGSSARTRVSIVRSLIFLRKKLAGVSSPLSIANLLSELIPPITGSSSILCIRFLISFRTLKALSMFYSEGGVTALFSISASVFNLFPKSVSAYSVN